MRWLCDKTSYSVTSYTHVTKARLDDATLPWGRFYWFRLVSRRLFPTFELVAPFLSPSLLRECLRCAMLLLSFEERWPTMTWIALRLFCPGFGMGQEKRLCWIVLYSTEVSCFIDGSLSVWLVILGGLMMFARCKLCRYTCPSFFGGGILSILSNFEEKE